MALILELHSEGKSSRQITADLAERGITAKRGGPWHSITAGRVIARYEATP